MALIKQLRIIGVFMGTAAVPISNFPNILVAWKTSGTGTNGTNGSNVWQSGKPGGPAFQPVNQFEPGAWYWIQSTAATNLATGWDFPDFVVDVASLGSVPGVGGAPLLTVNSAREASFGIPSGKVSTDYEQQFVPEGGTLGAYSALPGTTVLGGTATFIVPDTRPGTLYVRLKAVGGNAAGNAGTAPVTIPAVVPGIDQLDFNGDSLTFGIEGGSAGNLVQASTNYPTVVKSLLGLTSFGEYYTDAWPGATITQIEAAIAPYSYYRVDHRHYRHSIACLLAGANDILQGQSFASITANLTAFHAARRAKGWATVAITVPVLQGFTAQCQQVNDWIRANYESVLKASALAELDTDGRINNPADTTTRGADGIHFNGAGYTVIGEIVAAAIQRAVARRNAGVLAPVQTSATVPNGWTYAKPGDRIEDTDGLVTYSAGVGSATTDYQYFWNGKGRDIPAGEKATIRFWGPKVAVATLLGNNDTGTMELWVDGVQKLSTPTNSAGVQGFASYAHPISGLSDGDHTLEVRAVGAHIWFDCAVVPL